MGFMNLFKHFLGDDWGVHPDDHKRPAADQPVRVMPVPAKLYLPLQQHLGGAARPSVLVGQKVKKGEMIIMPANEPHALQAVNMPYKMILTMIKSD